MALVLPDVRVGLSPLQVQVTTGGPGAICPFPAVQWCEPSFWLYINLPCQDLVGLNDIPSLPSGLESGEAQLVQPLLVGHTAHA